MIANRCNQPASWQLAIHHSAKSVQRMHGRYQILPITAMREEALQQISFLPKLPSVVPVENGPVRHERTESQHRQQFPIFL